MKQRLDIGQEDPLRAKLEDSERQSMRSSLIAYMENNPLRGSAVTTSISSNSDKKHFLPVALIILVLLMIFGVGVSYAAERAIPGDILYSIKRDVNEHVEGLFAVSTKSKAEYNVALANRRLDEASALAAEAKLTPSLESSLSHDLENQMASFKANIERLQVAHDTSDADAVNQEFESTLSAHAAVVPMLLGTSDMSFATTSTTSQVR